MSSKKQSESAPVVEYLLDPDDRICGVNEAWDEFARRNEAPHLCSPNIIGRHIGHFITGDVTKMFVNTLIEVARLRKTSLTKPYRCDSPQVKRFMEMTVAPESGGLLRLTHRLLRVEPLQFPLRFRLALGDKARFLSRCSMCNRIRKGDQWLEPDAALPSPPDDGEVMVIYGVCPDCMASVSRLRSRAEK